MYIDIKISCNQKQLIQLNGLSNYNTNTIE